MSELILRNYQTDIVNKTRQAFKQGFKSPLIVLPCGSGKTAVFAWMASQSQAKGLIVWFLVHRQELLTQTIDTFNRFDIPTDKITIAMVQTIANHLEDYPKPDLIVFDEAHFSAAKTWGKIIEAFPDAYKIGLTATPCRLDGKPLGKIYDTMITGITAKELIQDGMLSKYTYYSATLADFAKVKTKCGDYDQEQAAEILSKSAILGGVVQHYKELANNKKAICYCPTIKFSENIADIFQSAGINAVHFDGNTPEKQRKDIIAKFRTGEIKILCNVDLISVGFDVPTAECCILLRPTQSVALFIQQAMRALRPLPGKIAIILDHVGNALRHGLPDNTWDWSLTEKPKRKNKEENSVFVRQCEKCFFTFETKKNTVCPNCGHENKKTVEEIKIIEAVKLQELKEAEAIIKKQARRNVHTCKDYSDLIEYGKKYGYKSGWAYTQAKIRGFL